MGKRIILVGATGRVGALTLEDLVKAGHEVVACARGASKILASQQVEPMTLDLHDPLSQITDAFRKMHADALFSLLVRVAKTSTRSMPWER